MTDVTITDDADGSDVVAAPGDDIRVHLAENPSTGFRWSVEGVDPGLELAGDQFHVAGTPLVPGAGGVHEWHFHVIEPGRHAIRLRLWRDWEGDDSVTRRFTVHIVTD